MLEMKMARHKGKSHTFKTHGKPELWSQGYVFFLVKTQRLLKMWSCQLEVAVSRRDIDGARVETEIPAGALNLCLWFLYFLKQNNNCGNKNVSIEHTLSVKNKSTIDKCGHCCKRGISQRCENGCYEINEVELHSNWKQHVTQIPWLNQSLCQTSSSNVTLLLTCGEVKQLLNCRLSS